MKVTASRAVPQKCVDLSHRDRAIRPNSSQGRPSSTPKLGLVPI
jgi:hypothetical protein